MLFVTVGTYLGEDLVKEVDKIANDINDKIIIQIGCGKYEPKNCEYFRFAQSLTTCYKESTLIIGHGGVGTVFELLNQDKRFIGVSNVAIPDKHQDELLEKLSYEKYILWCKDLNNLKDYINISKTFKFKKYKPPFCNLDEVIVNFLKTTKC